MTMENPGLKIAFAIVSAVGAVPFEELPFHNMLGNESDPVPVPIPMVTEGVCGAILKVPPAL